VFFYFRSFSIYSLYDYALIDSLHWSILIGSLWLVLLLVLWETRLVLRFRPSQSNRTPPQSSSMPTSSLDVSQSINIRIVQEPLIAQNFATIISAIIELHTICWLIAMRRFADLIEYTQTHNAYFEQEAHLVIAELTHNSPADVKFNLDISPQAVVEALVKAIDGIAQAPQRFEKAELENQAKAQEIEYATQRADQEDRMAQLEREKQRLEIERQRLDLVEKRLEVQKKGIDYALEIANKMADILDPDADVGTRAMLIQSLLPKLLKLDSGQGLELALPPPQEN